MNTRYYSFFVLAITGGLLTMFIIMVVFIFFRTPDTSSKPATPLSREQVEKILENTTIVISPEPNKLLAPSIQSFLVTAGSPFPWEEVEIQLFEKEFSSDSEKQRRDITIEENQATQKVITTKFHLLPNSFYTIRITRKQTNQEIAKVTYQTNDEEQTSPPLNQEGQILRNSLPHETNSYRLRYNEETKTFIFNFIFQPSIPGSINNQYNNAREEAESFIRSLNIEPTKLVIEWKHS
jgi:hypothetical protein